MATPVSGNLSVPFSLTIPAVPVVAVNGALVNQGYGYYEVVIRWLVVGFENTTYSVQILATGVLYNQANPQQFTTYANTPIYSSTATTNGGSLSDPGSQLQTTIAPDSFFVPMPYGAATAGDVALVIVASGIPVLPSDVGIYLSTAQPNPDTPEVYVTRLLGSPATGVNGSAVTMVGKVDAVGTAPVALNTANRVRWSTTTPAGTAGPSGTATADTAGNFSFSFTPSSTGTWIVQAYFDADNSSTLNTTATSAEVPAEWGLAVTPPVTNLFVIPEPPPVKATPQNVAVTQRFQVIGTNGQPRSGQAVTVARTGANPAAAASAGTTDASGFATYTYTPTNHGVDVLTPAATGSQANVPSEVVVTRVLGTAAASIPFVARKHDASAFVGTVVGTITSVPAGVMAFDTAPPAFVPGSLTHSVVTDASGNGAFPIRVAAAGLGLLSAYADLPASTVGGGATEAPGMAIITGYPSAGVSPNQPVAITMTPAASTGAEDTPFTVTARLLNQQGVGISGAVVTFTRSGANPGTGSATTNSLGDATHTYTGTEPGGDIIVATHTATAPVFGVATRVWTPAAAIENRTAVRFSPPVMLGSAGAASTVQLVAEVVNPTTAAVTPYVGNVRVQLADGSTVTVTTNASGQGSFSFAPPTAGAFHFTGYADNDNDNVRDGNELPGAAVMLATPTLAPSSGTVAPSGISSAEAFGTPTISQSQVTEAGNIASAEAFGSPVVVSGASSDVPVPQSIAATGIASAEAFGSHTVQGQIIINPAGIASAEAFGFHSVSGGTQPSTPLPPSDYTVKVVDRSGNVMATIYNANVEMIRWELNEAGMAAFTCHADDPAAREVRLVEREVQFFKGTDLLFWGVPTRAQADTDTVRFQCNGLYWYLTRRFMGKADRQNFVSNPSFEEGTTIGPAWGVTASTTAALDTTRKLHGARSAKLTSSSAGQDRYLFQTFSHTATAVGSLLTLVGWFNLQNTGFLGGALGDRGLYLSRRTGSTVHEEDWAFIDQFSPRDSWQRLETTVHMPPNAVQTIEVRLYAPGGSIYWDAISLTLMESLSFYDTDQSTIVAGIVQHAQDTGYDKSPLNIETSTGTSGVKRDRHYQFAEHQNIADALAEFTELADGFDFDIEVFTAPPRRVFVAYYPEKGVHRTDITLTTSNIARWAYRVDGERAASSIVVLGDQDGPDREEGAAIDTAALGGVILEDVIAAPAGTSIDSLDTRAAEELAARKVGKMLTVTTHEGAIDLVDNIAVGDRIELALGSGYTQVTGTWRVVAIELDPATETATLELNQP